MTGGIKVSAYSELIQYIDTISIINTHCHKLPQKQGFPASIKDLIEHSYLGWCHKEWDGTKEKATNFIRSLRHNSYFFGLKKVSRLFLIRKSALTRRIILGSMKKLKNYRKRYLQIMAFCGVYAITTKLYWMDTGILVQI